jgi:DNA invertase Pin-like site-specific DNA recombinase
MAEHLAMPTQRPTERAVQYWRMSTENQRYSFENQAAVISAYALDRDLELVRTYADAGKSGLTLKGRAGLQQLLADALSPERDFSAILVLDVSRWGRFQDTDQAAHYEYLCRAAGVRVVYCGEGFENDGGFVASVAKTLKRAMAAEFSRELSVKVARAQKQQVLLGYWQGGPAPYGFQRVLVDRHGATKCTLEPHEMKAMRDERVVVRPGPPKELAVLRLVFRLYVTHGLTIADVARGLNKRGFRLRDGSPWAAYGVGAVLRNELCIGRLVWNRTDQTLRKGRRPRPSSEWVRVQVLPPVVPLRLFGLAQERMAQRASGARLSDAVLLDGLRSLLQRRGVLTTAIIQDDPQSAGDRTYVRRFGSLRRAFELIGYVRPPLWRVARRIPRTDDAVIEGVQRLHRQNGYVSGTMINADRSLPGIRSIYRHFGSLVHLYELAGLTDNLHEAQVQGSLRGHRERRLRVARAVA